MRKSIHNANNKQSQVSEEFSVGTAAMSEEFYPVEKSVTFDYNVRVRTTMARRHYTDEEIEQCWFSKDEYDDILRSCNKQIRKMNQGQRLKDRKYCERGLEVHTDVGAMERSLNKKRARRAVMEAQMELIFNDDWCDEVIADAYRTATMGSQEKAHIKALLDHKEVTKRIEKDSHCSSSSS